MSFLSFKRGDLVYFVINNSSSGSFQHYGVKGMKWGVRKEYEPHPRKTKGSSNEGMETSEKSSRRERLIQKMMARGYSEKDAELIVSRRIKIEKAIAISAGVALTTAVVMSAYKNYANNVDKILKSGTKIQNMTGDLGFIDYDALYGSYGFTDKAKYRGIYGQSLYSKGKKKGMKDVSVFSRQFIPKENVRVAYDETGKKVLRSLVDQDPSRYDQYATYLDQVAEKFTGNVDRRSRETLKRGADNLRKGIVNGKTYDAFNIALTNHTADNAREIQKTFYDALKKRGYAAVGDVNDRKYTGFYTKTPTIIFDFEKIGESSVQKTGIIDRTVSSGVAAAGLAKDYVADHYGVGVAAVSALLGNEVSEYLMDRQYYEEYKKEHPNSKATFRQIIASRDRKT